MQAADLNGDGHADIVAADSSLTIDDRFAQGRVYTFSGADGSLLHTIDTPNPDLFPNEDNRILFSTQFGTAVSLADVNNDGTPDLLVTAPGEDVPATTVREGSERPQYVSAAPPVPAATRSRASSAALSPCVQVPPEYVCLAGRAYVFDGQTGDLLTTIDDPSPTEAGVFGWTGILADVTGDGTPEAVIGHATEVASAYSLETGAVIREFPQNRYYQAGDSDGDDKDDLLYYDTNHNIVGGSGGRAIIEFGDASRLSLPLTSPNVQPGAAFGTSVFGDLDGDGVKEIVVSAYSEDIDYPDQGRIYIMCACDDDTDGDGWSSAAELYLGRESAVACHNEAGLPDWPPDFDNNRAITISDVLAMKPYFNQPVEPPFRHFDLAPSGMITISDVLAIKPIFGATCTP